MACTSMGDGMMGEFSPSASNFEISESSSTLATEGSGARSLSLHCRYALPLIRFIPH